MDLPAPVLRRMLGMAVITTVVTLAASHFGSTARAPAIGWGAAAVFYNVDVWTRIARIDATATAAHARTQQPPRWARILLLNAATGLSLVTVGLLIIDGNKEQGIARPIIAALAMMAVFASWLLIHTVFTLRYAALYYSASPPGGIEFNEQCLPRYTDFAYMAFSVGMTYQVSDTNISDTQIRTTVLIQSWYGFLFATFITATTINLALSLL